MVSIYNIESHCNHHLLLITYLVLSCFTISYNVDKVLMRSRIAHRLKKKNKKNRTRYSDFDIKPNGFSLVQWILSWLMRFSVSILKIVTCNYIVFGIRWLVALEQYSVFSNNFKLFDSDLSLVPLDLFFIRCADTEIQLHALLHSISTEHLLRF